ncbi:hypothetical protein AMTR_s00093p00121160 [Amborella trichopoda]|uniref:Uncharacterized protein n=1 Tax=Amborella trichopoda TaxID=13333 RepID=W1NSR0_AMBTC|nr:hypothetical protein AMTR_s00093p00121160 [Amborella trichopoda]
MSSRYAKTSPTRLTHKAQQNPIKLKRYALRIVTHPSRTSNGPKPQCTTLDKTSSFRPPGTCAHTGYEAILGSRRTSSTTSNWCPKSRHQKALDHATSLIVEPR